MHELISQVNDLLTGHGFSYAICGGFAIDLFLGHDSRVHSDIDIFAWWEDRDRIILYMQSLGFHVYEMLGGGKAHHITDIAVQERRKKNIFCFRDGCELVQLYPTDEAGIYWIDFHHTGQKSLNFVEFLFNSHDEAAFLYDRDISVRRELSRTIRHRDGIPYLAPEICLLYKSTTTEREGYQQDYDLAFPAMDEESRSWLKAALRHCNPGGHKWLP